MNTKNVLISSILLNVCLMMTSAHAAFEQTNNDIAVKIIDGAKYPNKNMMSFSFIDEGPSLDRIAVPAVAQRFLDLGYRPIKIELTNKNKKSVILSAQSVVQAEGAIPFVKSEVIAQKLYRSYLAQLLLAGPLTGAVFFVQADFLSRSLMLSTKNQIKSGNTDPELQKQFKEMKHTKDTLAIKFGVVGLLGGILVRAGDTKKYNDEVDRVLKKYVLHEAVQIKSGEFKEYLFFVDKEQKFSNFKLELYDENDSIVAHFDVVL